MSFLEAAENGPFESRRDQAPSKESLLCGARLAGEQDDLLRLAHYTFLAKAFQRDINLLAARIRVLPQVLQRALEKYEKLHVVLRHRGSVELVATLARWIRDGHSPSDEELEKLRSRVSELAVTSSTPSGDGLFCVGVQLAELLQG